MHVIIQKLKPDEINRLAELMDLFTEVFEEVNFTMPPQPYWQGLLQQDTVWVFVALIDGQLVGGLTAYILPAFSSRRPMVYLYDLAVRDSFQRQGIGRQLLTHLTQEARRVGASEVFVQADAGDAEAIAFYQATSGQAQRVVQFTYPLPP